MSTSPEAKRAAERAAEQIWRECGEHSDYLDVKAMWPIIQQAIDAATANLREVLEGIAADCDEVSRDDSISAAEKRAWTGIGKRAKRALAAE